MMSADRVPPGYRLAQLAAVGAVLGGAFDASITRLLPHHAAFLGVAVDAVSPRTAELLLLMLRTLGIALLGVGVSALALLDAWRRGASNRIAVVAAAMLVLVEGANALAVRRVGSPLYLGPAMITVMAVVGVAMAVRARASRSAGSG